MATYRIRPCARLSGEITVHSAKNAVLPLMCGALLTRETVTIEQIPALTDVKTLTDILRIPRVRRAGRICSAECARRYW